MTDRLIKPIFMLLAFVMVLTGCTDNKELSDLQSQESKDRAIILNLNASDETRAAVDKWDNTPVSIGYVFAPATLFNRSLTVSVTDSITGEHINTGMEYPLNHSPVSFIGYHPVAAPNAAGVVTYDISKGDVDVMMSNSVSGTDLAPITNKLVFKHKLTRVTFVLRCASGQSYPEPIFGIQVSSASTTKTLSSAVTLDLEAETVNFKIPGSVFAGDLDGFVVPKDGNSPVVLDFMLQPNIPLAFSVLSLTGGRDIIITGNLPDWDTLTKIGGDAGKKYTVVLSFSGVEILAQGITVTPWTSGNQNMGGNTVTWW